LKINSNSKMSQRVRTAKQPRLSQGVGSNANNQ